MSQILVLLFSLTIAYAENVLVTAPRPEPQVLTIETSREENPKLSELMTELPNVNFTSGANRPRFFQIRGTGETGQFEHSQVGSLGVFYEGIDLSEESSALPLLGREFVDVLYGPQSLAWGGKALAGTIETKSCLEKDCANRWAASAGNYGSYGIAGGNDWKTKGLKGILGLHRSVSDGFIENDFLKKPTANQDDAEAVVGLTYRLGEWKLREHHIYIDHNDGYDSWATEPGYHTISDHPGKDRIQLHGHSLQYETGAWRGLTSATFTHQLESYDEDWGNNPFWNTIPGWNADYNYYSTFERSRLKLHQKLSRQFTHGFEAGLHIYAFQEKQVIRSFEDESLRKITEPDFSTKNAALWLSKEWHGDKWTTEAAARIEEQWSELEGLGGRMSSHGEPMWGFELTFKRHTGERHQSEISLSRGYRGGGYNTSPNLDRDLLHFGPEDMYLAQATSEGATESGRWLLRAFYQWRERQQVRSSLQTDPTDPSTFTYYTDNAGSSRAYGLETALTRNYKRWTASATLGLIESRFRDHELPQSPPWTYSAKLEYAPNAFRTYIQVSGRDGYYFSDDHEFKSRPYTLADAGASYRAGSWDFRLWVRNLFDKRYPVRAFYFANEPPAWEPKYYTQAGDPRTFGAQVVFEY